MVLRWAVTLVIAALATNEAGQKYLAEKEGEEGVIKLKSGLMYKVLKKGDGKFHPTVDSPCECHYQGTLIDGTEFDSSYKRGQPTTFAPNQVIKGWTEAMQLMVEGDKWEMYIPSELGYGEGGSGDKIKPGDALVFQMEILTIKGGKKRAAKCILDTRENCDEEENALLNELTKMSPADQKKELAELKKRTKQTMKKGEYEQIAGRLKMLKKLVKAVKAKGEL
eukprot:CAMPEP_0204320668 /NCGR_PEP_ID=MMETSP0469-20131031/7758_1 /ASSEMBLY_ACC=CAM_ASM_000384 /TAXON_ID=2969 /ORGANISM="Oxyrrhis marina" /LENGTH=222 /DNA_ID=CAMNT_0051301933 /DNA_START=37 /DNA_END=705 /DNA_ORIENTATION=-